MTRLQFLISLKTFSTCSATSHFGALISYMSIQLHPGTFVLQLFLNKNPPGLKNETS